MAEIHVSQEEADALLAMEKRREQDRVWRYPELGGKLTIPLVSVDGREHFHLDISRQSIEVKRDKLQNRARQVVVLVRIDTGGTPHRNPDDSEVPCPHIHLYREGFGDRWAFTVPTDRFGSPEDAWQTLRDFMAFCNITDPPAITRGLFT
jgi:hypothetical protein